MEIWVVRLRSLTWTSPAMLVKHMADASDCALALYHLKMLYGYIYDELHNLDMHFSLDFL